MKSAPAGDRRGASAGGRRRAVAGLAAAALAAGLAACGSPARPPELRAVVLVDIDTLRSDGLSVYGNPRPTSPHFDALARAGTRFDWAFSQAPYTLPSQSSIITSLYPWVHGVWHPDDRLAPAATTLAESFRAAGWSTGAFVDGGYVKASFGFDQGFDRFEDLHGGGLARGEAPISEWLRAHSGSRFFLWIHTYDVHCPYSPPEPFRSKFAAMAPAPTPGFEPTKDAMAAIRASQWRGPRRELAPNDLAYARALYDGEVAFVDSWFGRFQEELRALGLADRTLIALVSDHGEEFQEHGSVLHEKLYATVTHVPLLIHSPLAPPGQVIRTEVQDIDVMPTLLELAGVPVPGGVQGRSLAGAVMGHGEPPPRPALAASPFWGRQRAIATGGLHLILTLDRPRAELFAYRRDPGEQLELSGSRRPDLARLLAALHRGFDATKPEANLHETGRLTSEAESELRALGYLQ